MSLPSAPPSALLLSGSLGMGHDVMAEACAVSLRDRNWHTTTLDSMKLLGSASSGLGELVFRGLMGLPGAYDAFHFRQLRTGGAVARVAERAACRSLVPALRQHLSEQPADLVVSVFATGAAAVSRLKAENPGMTTWVFCTDVCPHRLWVHPNTDLYLVTSQAAKAFVHRFEPSANVEVVSAPVRAQFHRPPTRSAARAALGIPGDARCVLLMSGSWGIGPLVEVAQTLADAKLHVIAVAGRNQRLEAGLRSAAQSQPRIIAFGFTDQIPQLMAAADVVITSSGDTCSEARAMGRHLLLLDVVPGHGRENLQHELERGGADVAPLDPAGLARSALAAVHRASTSPPTAGGSPALWEASFSAILSRWGPSRGADPGYAADA